MLGAREERRRFHLRRSFFMCHIIGKLWAYGSLISAEDFEIWALNRTRMLRIETDLYRSNLSQSVALFHLFSISPTEIEY